MMKLGEILRGCEPGRLQIVGNMAILPLVSDLIWDDVTSPASVLSDGGTTRTGDPRLAAATSVSNNYGTLVFANADKEHDMVIPSHTGYLTKENAQDHAMSTAGVVRKGGRKTYKNACCVESSQGGFLRPGERKMIILPWQLRADATMLRKRESYNKLWDSIGKYNRSYAIGDHGGHLGMFYEKYGQQLDQFIAEFEPVRNQVGAFIFVDGKLVGVERVPNHQYWKAIWPALVRECYGSLALHTRDKGEVQKPRLQKHIRIDRVNSLDDLERELDDTRKREDEEARSMIRDLSEIDFEPEEDEKDGVLVVKTIQDGGKRFTGQIVQKDGVPVIYVSLITTKFYHEHGEWQDAKAFSA